MKDILEELVEKWAKMVMARSNRHYAENDKITLSKFRNPFQYEIKELPTKEDIDNQNYNDCTIYFHVEDWIRNTIGDRYVAESFPFKEEAISCYFSGESTKIDRKLTEEKMMSIVMSQIISSRHTFSFNLGSAIKGTDFKVGYEMQISDTFTKQQTMQETEKLEMTASLIFNSEIKKYILSKAIDVVYQDYNLKEFILRGKIYIYFNNSHQIKYENGLFKKMDTIGDRTIFFNRVEIPITEIFDALKNEPILTDTFKRESGWSFAKEINQVMYKGKISQFLLPRPNYSTASEKNDNTKKRKAELIMTAPSLIPDIRPYWLRTNWNDVIENKWPPAYRQEQLPQISKCDYETFDYIWNTYDRERIYYSKGHTDILVATIKKINDDKQLDVNEKQTSIASKIVEYMNEPRNLHFRAILFDNIELLKSVSLELNDRTLRYKKPRIRR